MSSGYAHEYDFFGLSLNFCSPAYYDRPPVYNCASLVYVQPPHVIYDVLPRYGYYDAQPYYYNGKHVHGHGYAYGHYKHNHDDEDDD